mmetsp:Transcript_7508/g.19267  ORF Transcript_7508/g.19267 Transcript_7508/m.19267 type:complete len:211 (-) Transcript_7508:611-1243(-)
MDGECTPAREHNAASSEEQTSIVVRSSRAHRLEHDAPPNSHEGAACPCHLVQRFDRQDVVAKRRCRSGDSSAGRVAAADRRRCAEPLRRLMARVGLRRRVGLKAAPRARPQEATASGSSLLCTSDAEANAELLANLAGSLQPNVRLQLKIDLSGASGITGALLHNSTRGGRPATLLLEAGARQAGRLLGFARVPVLEELDEAVVGEDVQP